MEAVMHVDISLADLKTIITDIVGERLLDYFEKKDPVKNELLTYAQVFEKFYLKPERLIEWKRLGLINEYPEGKIVKFKISELFKAIETLVILRKEKLAKEAGNEQPV